MSLSFINGILETSARHSNVTEEAAL